MEIELNKLVQCSAPNIFFNRIIKLVLPAARWEVSIALVGDAEIKRLNRTYRAKNRVTDVLSFKYAPYQGEIVISYPQVCRQAKALKIKPQQELARLLIHGALHLRGLRDETAMQAAAMQRIENKIIKDVKF